VADGIRTHDNRNHNPGTYAENSSTYEQFIEDSTPWEAAPVLEAAGHLLRKNSTRFSGDRVNTLCPNSRVSLLLVRTR
jgi:hypothetical protein